MRLITAAQVVIPTVWLESIYVRHSRNAYRQASTYQRYHDHQVFPAQNEAQTCACVDPDADPETGREYREPGNTKDGRSIIPSRVRHRDHIRIQQKGIKVCHV